MGNQPCCGEEHNGAGAEVVQSDSKNAAGQEGVVKAEVTPLPITKSMASDETNCDATPRSQRSVQDTMDALSEAPGSHIKKKQHPQAYVRDFVKDLTKGTEVELLTTGTAASESTCWTAACSLDSAVKTLHLNYKEGNITCELAKITNVLQIEDGKASFPEKVHAALSDADLEKTVMVHYEQEDGAKTAFVMKDKSVEDRKRFCECIKLLHMHATKTGQPASTPLGSPRR